MRYYAVIDTNVVVSGLLKQQPSPPATLLALVLTGGITPLYNDEIVAEYRAVLLREKFGFAPQDVELLIEQIKNVGLKIERKAAKVQFSDEEDRKFYEVCIAERLSSAAYLVTGNIKHFPSERFIVTPRQMLNVIKEENI